MEPFPPEAVFRSMSVCPRSISPGVNEGRFAYLEFRSKGFMFRGSPLYSRLSAEGWWLCVCGKLIYPKE